MSNSEAYKNGQKTQFTSENQPIIAGRKKNRFKQIQNDFELSIDDMRQVIQDILSMSKDEIIKLKEKKDEPAYRLAIASAVVQCIKSGNWTQINYMFDRLFGKALEKIEHSGKITTDYSIIGIDADSDSEEDS